MNIRELVKKYEKQLKTDDYDGLFSECRDLQERSELLDFLYGKCGIDVLPLMTSIPSQMFRNTQQIYTLVIPENITSIGDRAFANSALSKVVLPETISKLPVGLFQNCANLHKLWIPDSVTEFAQDVFSGTPSDLLLGANSRTDAASKLRFPQSELDFYRQHLKFKRPKP